MTAVALIFAFVCVGIVLSALLIPEIKIKNKKISVFWVPPLLGVILLLSLGLLNFGETWTAISGSGAINPLKILILFLSMSLLSIFLDEAGFFRYLASLALAKAKDGQKALFFTLYAVVSVLTVFTSNDIIILTFTPFICYFAKNSDIDPVPYLVAEFVAANTFSMLLIIGNPTNIYLATALGIGFGEYFSVMWLPALLSGAVALLLLYLVFRKKLKKPFTAQMEIVHITDKPLLWLGIAHLSVCTVMLAVSSYVGIEMWLISFVSLVSLCVCSLVLSLIRKKPPTELANSFRKAPWQIVPFVLSMFVFVLALTKYGITDILAQKIGSNLWSVGYVSYFTANVINNIPMSVLMSDVVARLSSNTAAVYASIAGSNVGAFLTPIGALAGIMWLSLVKSQNVKISFGSFVKYGAVISIPTMAAALLGLEILF